MVTYRNGAENVPLRQVNNSMPVYVVIYDLQKDDAVVEEKRIDFSNPSDRQWLGRMSFWAYQNHCSIETMALADAEAELIKVENDK